MTVLTDVNVTLFEPFGDGSLFMPTQSFVHYRLSSNEEPLKDFLESGCMPIDIFIIFKSSTRQ